MARTRTTISRGHKNVNLTYYPMPKQKIAHGLTAKYRGFCGGWGNGKTSWGCAETFMRLHEFPRTTAIIARKTRPELKSTTWDMFIHGDPGAAGAWEGIPKDTIEFYNKSDMHIKFRNGSQVYGLPLDDPAKLENYNLGFFWVDQAEEIEEEIFLKFHGRLRQRVGPREGILTFNPNGHNWLWRKFIDPMRPLKWTQLYRCVEATTFDNFNLPEDYLDQFEGLPDAWIQRFVYGSHDVFVGQIFTDWNPDTHVIQPFRIPSSWQRWLCIDPGIRHEGALSWMARDHVGNVFYYRELLSANQPVAWWSEQMRTLETMDDFGGPNETVFRRLIGPEARQRSQTDSRSVLDVFNQHGVYPEIADRDPVARINKITDYLRPQTGHRSPWGLDPAPKLYVFATCNKMLEYLPQYRWRPQRVNYAEEHAAEEPRKKDDHNIDNLGHILLALDTLPVPDDVKYWHLSPEEQVLRELREEVYAEANNRAGERYHDLLGAHG